MRLDVYIRCRSIQWFSKSMYTTRTWW